MQQAALYQLHLLLFATPSLSTWYDLAPWYHQAAPWWKTTSLYQVYPRSFQDTDGDGTGDLKGITSRLSHFEMLGIDTVWLSPIFSSPMKDFGYDISNYTDIDPTFGTLEHLQELVVQVHQRNMKIILDFVPNHSSDQHIWFELSEARVDPYTDYYVWKDPAGWDEDKPLPPNNWISKVRTSAWTWSNKRQQFYYHQYQDAQPDLNYRCSELVNEMIQVLQFWLDQGVDGFRMDAVAHLMEDGRFLDEPLSGDPDALDELDYNYLEHIYTSNVPETRAMLARLTAAVKEYEAVDGWPRLVLLEEKLPINESMEYYECGDMPFNFNLVKNLVGKVTVNQIEASIDSWLSNMPEGKTANWVTGSHDDHRVASRMSPSVVDAMNGLAVLLPGVSVTYQGEEIGMLDADISWEDTVDPAGCVCGPDRYKECSRDPERTPMQWSQDKNAGFSSGSTTWLPVNDNYVWLNVEEQLSAVNAHNSHITFYTDVVEVRNQIQEMCGTMSSFSLSLDYASDFVLVVRRSCSAIEECFFLVISMSEEEEEVDLLPLAQGCALGQKELFVRAKSVGGNNVYGEIVDMESLRLGPGETVVIH